MNMSTSQANSTLNLTRIRFSKALLLAGFLFALPSQHALAVRGKTKAKASAKSDHGSRTIHVAKVDRPFKRPEIEGEPLQVITVGKAEIRIGKADNHFPTQNNHITTYPGTGTRDKPHKTFKEWSKLISDHQRQIDHWKSTFRKYKPLLVVEARLNDENPFNLPKSRIRLSKWYVKEAIDAALMDSEIEIKRTGLEVNLWPQNDTKEYSNNTLHTGIYLESRKDLPFVGGNEVKSNIDLVESTIKKNVELRITELAKPESAEKSKDSNKRPSGLEKNYVASLKSGLARGPELLDKLLSIQKDAGNIVDLEERKINLIDALKSTQGDGLELTLITSRLNNEKGLLYTDLSHDLLSKLLFYPMEPIKAETSDKPIWFVYTKYIKPPFGPHRLTYRLFDSKERAEAYIEQSRFAGAYVPSERNIGSSYYP